MITEILSHVATSQYFVGKCTVYTLTLTVTVTVTVTEVFILRFLLKDRKRITESFTYSAKPRLNKTVLRRRLKDVGVDRWSLNFDVSR